MCIGSRERNQQGLFILCCGDFCLYVIMIPPLDITVVFVGALCTIFIIWHTVQSMALRRNLPPGLRPWPLLGNIPSLIGKEPHILMTEIGLKFGGPVTFYFGTAPAVILTTLDEATEALVKQAGVFSDRKVPPLIEKAFSSKGSVLWERGSSWRFHRRSIHTGLRQIELSDGNLVSKVTLEMNKLFSKFDKNLGSPTNLSESFMALSARVICAVTFGSRLSSFAETDKFTRFLANVKLISTNVTIFAAAMIFPSLYDTFMYADVREAVDNMKSFLYDLLLEHRNMFEGNIRDIMDSYVAAMNKDSGQLEEKFIWRTFFDLLGAGTDTTANTLLWCVMYMCEYSHYQDMIYHEMEDKLGSDDVVSMKNQSILPLTNATLLEVMRSSPAVPLSVPRVTSADADFLGYKIPKGTEIWLNEYAIHHDKNIWNQPDEFRPERFLNAQEDSILSEKMNQLVPFGMGRRICIGKKLAEIELFLIFSNFFKRYKVRFAFPGQTLDRVGIFGLTYSPKPFQVVIEKR